MRPLTLAASLATCSLSLSIYYWAAQRQRQRRGSREVLVLAKLSNRDLLVSELMGSGHNFERACNMAYDKMLSEARVRFWKDQLKRRRERSSIKRMDDLG